MTITTENVYVAYCSSCEEPFEIEGRPVMMRRRDDLVNALKRAGWAKGGLVVTCPTCMHESMTARGFEKRILPDGSVTWAKVREVVE